MACQSQKEVVANEDRTVSIEIKEGDERDISSLSNNEWLNFMIDARGESRFGSINSLKPKIQKVQPMLHKVEFNKCYDPRVISIGPYHHGKPELYIGERIKIPLARQYVKDHSNAMVHELYEEVVNVAGEARKCYAKGLTNFTDESFARMMFLYGCFILQCIYGIVYAIPAVLEIIHHAPLVWRDLFMLENQLPFVVLEVLMRLEFKKHGGEKMISAFIKCFRGEPGERGGLMEKIENFFYKNVWRTQTHREMMHQWNSEDNPPIHLLELFSRQYIDSTTSSIGCHIAGDWYCCHQYPCPSFMDLRMVGIRFRPSYRLSNIAFKSTWTGGILILPKINIDDATISLLYNLVSYEHCPDSFARNLWVTNYISFLDSVIDSANDVKELKYAGIITNFLRNDEEVVKVISRMAVGLVPDTSYFRIMLSIKQYHSHKGKIWIASWIVEVMRNHFRSPWPAIAVLVALFALFLTAVQTYFAAFPHT